MKPAKPRNRQRHEIYLGENWIGLSRPVPGLEFLGTVQRGMHIAVLAVDAKGRYVAVERGYVSILNQRNARLGVIAAGGTPVDCQAALQEEPDK